MSTTRYYAAILDGDIEGADIRQSRAAAERDARWLRRHPACLDRRAFGLGGSVRVVQVAESEWTGKWVVITGEQS